MAHGYARPDLLAETDWLAEHLDDPDVRIVDCRYYWDGRDGRAVYQAGHIPGAVYCDWTVDLADPAQDPPNLIPGPERLAQAMGRLGIGNQTLVVGYDDEGGHYAARLWWVLRYYGHDRVKILNGGIQKWLAEGRPLATGTTVVAPARFQPGPPRADLRLRGEDLRRLLGQPQLLLLDVRRPSEYTGQEVRAARGGRIPGARHFFWQENLNPDWTFRDPESLRARHEAAGVRPDRLIVTYCQGGVRAAHAAFTLALLGYENVRLYDGSWAEWGNRLDWPVET